MARVTIEDCVASIANRFRLVMCSAQRGRELASGVEPTVERDRLIKQEKNAVIALREITQGNLDVEALEDSIVRNHRRFSPIEAATEEDAEGGAEGGGARLSAGVEGIAGDPAEVLPEIHAEAVFGAADSGEAASADGSEAASDEGSEVASDEGSEVAPSDDKVADEEGG